MSRELFKQIIDTSITQSAKSADERDYGDRDALLKQIFVQKATEILNREPDPAAPVPPVE